MRLSIVTTMYNSSEYIDEFYVRASATAKQITENDYEIIFVNDGSPDNSMEKALNLNSLDGAVKIIDLSRNFGHHKAMMAGLDYASGDLVFLIDSDLEEEPEWLIPFYEKLQEPELPIIDVAFGVQNKRKGKWFERYSGAIFYTMINLISSTKIPYNLVTARLMRKRYVKALLSHREREPFIAGLWAITGFNQQEVKIKKGHSSPSNYTFIHKLRVTIRALLSSSSAPLKFLCFFGITIFILSFFFATYLGYRQYFFGASLPGWTSVMVSVWIFGGLTIFSIGLVGLYIAKTYTEVKQRPNYLVRELIGFTDNDDST